MAELLLAWQIMGLLKPSALPAGVAPIPPLPITARQANSPGLTALLGFVATLPPTTAASPVWTPPGAPAAPPAAPSAPEPSVNPAEGAEGGGALISPLAAGVTVAVVILLWSTNNSPRWADETSPITGEPYAGPEEYDWTARLTPAQQEYLRRLPRHPTLPAPPQPAPKPPPGPTPVTRVAPAPQPQPKPKDPEKKPRRRRRRPARYPILWPTQWPPPVLLNRWVTEFRRVPSARDDELAKRLRQEKWVRATGVGLSHKDFQPHHVIPLYVGGPDLPLNIVLWNTVLHREGHESFDYQPQMLSPPPGLPPLPPDLKHHPAGTPYRLAGFKRHKFDLSDLMRGGGR
jgi:hypothetical protein